MKTANGTEYNCRPEERETHIRWDPVGKVWIAWSCIPKHIDQFKRQGWTITEENKDGLFFEAPAHAVKIMPAEKKKRQMTDKQREALAKNRFPSRKQSEEFSRDNNADETPYKP